jgi:ribosome-associated protein
VLLDINAVASFADYFVIATALNPRHMNALMLAFDKDLPNEGIKALRREGESGSGWVLIDFGAVIVHLFTPEGRDFYDLEGLWSRAGVPAVRFQ